MKGLKMDADLEVMEADALRMRVKRPFIFTNFKSGEGVDQIASFVIAKGRLAESPAIYSGTVRSVW
jgi:urease accessory protein